MLISHILVSYLIEYDVMGERISCVSESTNHSQLGEDTREVADEGLHVPSCLHHVRQPKRHLATLKKGTFW